MNNIIRLTDEQMKVLEDSLKDLPPISLEIPEMTLTLAEEALGVIDTDKNAREDEISAWAIDLSWRWC